MMKYHRLNIKGNYAVWINETIKIAKSLKDLAFREAVVFNK